jgi:hypothetical protein
MFSLWLNESGVKQGEGCSGVGREFVIALSWSKNIWKSRISPF